MATKLGLYQAAVMGIKESKLSSITEDRESRHHLDLVYDDVVADCLEEGLWNFALRSVKAENDTALETDFGHQYVFAKPDDWVRTAMLCEDPDFKVPMVNVSDEGSNWTAYVDTFYLKYVSNDVDHGLDLGLWPRSFTRFVELSLAERICSPASGSDDMRKEIKKDLKQARRNALNKDAMNEAAVRFPPTGSWAGSRGRRMSPRDRWSVT